MQEGVVWVIIGIVVEFLKGFLKEPIWRIRQGTIVGLIKGDTGSLEYGSYPDPFRPARTVHAASFFRPFLHRDLMS